MLYGEKPPKWCVTRRDALRFRLLAVLMLMRRCLVSRVVFNEVVQTTKYYMRDVTAVESCWLVELAPHFYKQAKVSGPPVARRGVSTHIAVVSRQQLLVSLPLQHGSLASKRSRVL